MVLGGGFLAGIGFTKTLFVASLALEGEILGVAKVGVIGGSVVDAIFGLILLARVPAVSVSIH